MAKNKSNSIPHYELLYIISNKYSEDEVHKITQKIDKIITDNNGIITKEEEWGKKRLSYPIKSFNYGYYQLVEFDAEGKNLFKINKIFHLSNDILRFQIVAKKQKTKEEIKKENDIKEKISTQETVKEKLTKEKEKGTIDLKDLDKKLDKILETDDLL